MGKGLLFVLLCLGVFRAWRLAGRDDIFARVRVRLPGPLISWLSCPWCAGLVMSIAAVFVVDRWFVPLPLPVVWAGAVGSVVALLGEIDAKLGD